MKNIIKQITSAITSQAMWAISAWIPNSKSNSTNISASAASAARNL